MNSIRQILQVDAPAKPELRSLKIQLIVIWILTAALFVQWTIRIPFAMVTTLVVGLWIAPDFVKTLLWRLNWFVHHAFHKLTLVVLSVVYVAVVCPLAFIRHFSHTQYRGGRRESEPLREDEFLRPY